MGTMMRLHQAKKKLAQAQQEMPGAYENQYAGDIQDRLGKMEQATLGGSSGLGEDLAQAYDQYRAKAVANAQGGAQAATRTAQDLAGGYGAGWADKAANLAAGEQIAGVDNGLAGLRSNALQNWRQQLADSSSVLDQLLGQQSLDRSKYDTAVANAQDWRDYRTGRVDQARQENANFWNNVWNGVKGAANVVKTGYDAYRGYQQQDWENQFAERQYNDSQTRAKASDQIMAMQQAQAFKEAGFDDLARQTLTRYGLDETMLDAWQGLSTVEKEKMAALVQGASLASTGNDTAARNYLQMAGVDSGATDTYGTMAARQNQAKVDYQNALLAMQRRYSSGSGGSRSGNRSGNSGNRSSGNRYTSGNVTSLINKMAGMDPSNPMYSVMAGELQKAGVDMSSVLDAGQEEAAKSTGGTGNTARTTPKLPTVENKKPWKTVGTVDGVAGASTSLSEARGGNYGTALREARQMENNGYGMDQITEYLIRKNYSDSVISQVSVAMGW